MGNGEVGTHHTELMMERGREERGTLEDVLLCKTSLTVNAIAVEATSTSQSKSTWNTGACTGT